MSPWVQKYNKHTESLLNIIRLVRPFTDYYRLLHKCWNIKPHINYTQPTFSFVRLLARSFMCVCVFLLLFCVCPFFLFGCFCFCYYCCCCAVVVLFQPDYQFICFSLVRSFSFTCRMLIRSYIVNGVFEKLNFYSASVLCYTHTLAQAIQLPLSLPTHCLLTSLYTYTVKCMRTHAHSLTCSTQRLQYVYLSTNTCPYWHSHARDATVFGLCRMYVCSACIAALLAFFNQCWMCATALPRRGRTISHVHIHCNRDDVSLWFHFVCSCTISHSISFVRVLCFLFCLVSCSWFCYFTRFLSLIFSFFISNNSISIVVIIIIAVAGVLNQRVEVYIAIMSFACIPFSFIYFSRLHCLHAHHISCICSL